MRKRILKKWIPRDGILRGWDLVFYWQVCYTNKHQNNKALNKYYRQASSK